MLQKLKKSVEIEKMPSVRVRPTLRVEMKHRVMNCKLKGQQKKNQPINVDLLNDQVLNAVRKSKRANLGGEHEQFHMI